MDELQQFLFSRGYIRLQPGSYHTWVSKRWHEMFARRGLVRKNLYSQYVPNMDTLQEFIKWMDLYDKSQHDRDFPKSKPFLKPEELLEIRREIY